MLCYLIHGKSFHTWLYAQINKKNVWKTWLTLGAWTFSSLFQFYFVLPICLFWSLFLWERWQKLSEKKNFKTPPKHRNWASLAWMTPKCKLRKFQSFHSLHLSYSSQTRSVSMFWSLYVHNGVFKYKLSSLK